VLIPGGALPLVKHIHRTQVSFSLQNVNRSLGSTVTVAVLRKDIQNKFLSMGSDDSLGEGFPGHSQNLSGSSVPYQVSLPVIYQ
jgi:hypothetical protein